MRRVMLLFVGVMLLGGVPGVAHAVQRAFVAASPVGAVATNGDTGSIAIDLVDGEGTSLTAPIAGLRPDDEVPDDDQPTDAFAERELTIRNAGAVPSSVGVTVGFAPGVDALEGLRVAVARVDESETVVVPDIELPATSAPIADVGVGEVVTLKFRFRLAHDAPASAVGQDTVVRVTFDVQARAGGNR